MSRLDPTHERIECPKCSRKVWRRVWDGWIETHECEPLCAACGHERFHHRPVCAGEKEFPFICLQDCMRFVDPRVCPHCEKSSSKGWLPERLIGEPFPGRWMCPCNDQFSGLPIADQRRAEAIIALEEGGQSAFDLGC